MRSIFFSKIEGTNPSYADILGYPFYIAFCLDLIRTCGILDVVTNWSATKSEVE